MSDTERLQTLRGILKMITEDVVTQAEQIAELGWDKYDAAEAAGAWWRSNVDAAIGTAKDLIITGQCE